MARTNTDEIELDLIEQLRIVRDAMDPQDDTREDWALCGIETFCAIALLVFAKTNPSKIRAAAVQVEIKARMDGKPVLKGVDA